MRPQEEPLPLADARRREAPRKHLPLDGEEQEYLRLFALICELSFDVYLKKQMIELLADQLRSESPDRDRKKK